MGVPPGYESDVCDLISQRLDSRLKVPANVIVMLCRKNKKAPRHQYIAEMTQRIKLYIYWRDRIQWRQLRNTSGREFQKNNGRSPSGDKHCDRSFLQNKNNPRLRSTCFCQAYTWEHATIFRLCHDCDSSFQTRGVLPSMTHIGRSWTKGVSFSGSRLIKG